MDRVNRNGHVKQDRRSRRLRMWRRVALSISASGALLGLAAVCGVFSPWLDLLSHLLPVWLLVGVGAALASACLGGSRPGDRLAPALPALITIGCALVLASSDTRPLTVAAATPGGPPPLRLVQLNMWKHNRALPQTADWILAQRPDVVVLEEAFAQNLPLVRRLRTRLPYRVSCTGRDPCSTTILSRLPPVAWGGLKGGDLTAPLAGAWATYHDQGGRFSVLAVQLPWPVPPEAQQRRARQLVGAAQGLEQDSLIIAGDFNATPWSHSLRRLDRELGLQRVTRGIPTWPARGFLWTPRSLAFMPIDQIYVGRHWRLRALRRGERVGSDHYPLVVDLQRGPVPPKS